MYSHLPRPHKDVEFNGGKKIRIEPSDGRDQDFEVETETETFILGFVESRQRPRLLFFVSPWCHGTKDKVESTMYFCEHKQINFLIQKNKGNSSVMKEHKLL